MDQVLQLRASSRSLGPARARADLLAQQSAHAGAVAQSELSTRMGHKESAQPWTHQMARARAFYRTSLCRRIGGTEKDRGWHPRSLSRFPSHRLALRPRSGRNAAGLHCPSSLMLSACPPLESERAAWRRAPEQTAAPPSSYLASLFRRAPSRPTAKVSPMSLDQTVTHVIRLSPSPADILALACGAPGEDFRRHVENDLMKRTPHPDAKPMGAFSLGLRPK